MRRSGWASKSRTRRSRRPSGRTCRTCSRTASFSARKRMPSMLAQQNLTIPEFENDMRRQMLIARLRAVALEGTIVTPQEIEQEYRKRNEKIKVEYVKLTADQYKNESQPTTRGNAAVFRGEQGRVHDAGAEEPGGADCRPGQDRADRQRLGRRAAARLHAEPEPVSHRREREGAAHPAEDAGQAAGRRGARSRRRPTTS